MHQVAGSLWVADQAPQVSVEPRVMPVVEDIKGTRVTSAKAIDQRFVRGTPACSLSVGSPVAL